MPGYDEFSDVVTVPKQFVGGPGTTAEDIDAEFQRLIKEAPPGTYPEGPPQYDPNKLATKRYLQPVNLEGYTPGQAPNYDQFSDVVEPKAKPEATDYSSFSDIVSVPAQEENPLITATKEAGKAIPERFIEQGQLVKSGALDVASLGKRGVLKKKVFGISISDYIRRPVNIVGGMAKAPLGIIGMATSPTAAVNGFFGELAAQDARRTMERNRIMSGGDLRGPNATEQKRMDEHAARVKTAVGLTAETLFTYWAAKKWAAIKEGKRTGAIGEGAKAFERPEEITLSIKKKPGAYVTAEEGVPTIYREPHYPAAGGGWRLTPRDYEVPAFDLPDELIKGRFHGTPKEIEVLEEFTYSPQNIYGQGFYTTDRMNIARGYAKRRPQPGSFLQTKKPKEAPYIYEVKESKPVKLYDLEKPLDDETRTVLKDIFEPQPQEYTSSGKKYISKAPPDDAALDALDESKTLGEFYDNYRQTSRENLLTADDVQETFDAIQYELGKRGYRGFRHTGGKFTGNQPHEVNIYWYPKEDITIKQSPFSDMSKKAKVLTTSSEQVVQAKNPPPIPKKPSGIPGPAAERALPRTRGVSPEAEEDIRKAYSAAIEQGVVGKTEGERIFRTVARSIAEGEIDPNSWVRIRDHVMKIGGLTQEEADVALANEYMSGISESGRSLQRLSRLKKELEKTLSEDAKRILDGIPDYDEAITEKLWRGFKKIEQTRRSFLVTQMATASRNAIEQGGRFGITVVNDAVEGVLETLTGRNPKQAFDQLFQDGIAFSKRLSPAARAKLEETLKSMPLAEARLLRRPIAELKMGKVSDALNIYNRTQEFFFRRLFFESKFRTNLKKIGLNLDELTPEELSSLSLGAKDSPFNKALEGAIDHALLNTYAKVPKGRGAQEILQVFNNPIATALGNPFPRFWMNSLHLLYEYSPAGVLSMLKPSTVAQIASGNFEKAIPAMSKAMTGTLLFGMAGAIRESEYGENRKWYEIKTQDGNVLDARVYGATARYLFLWDAVFHPERLDAGDWAEGLFLVNRVAGTGLILTDLLRGKSQKGAIKILSDFAGKYASGFTVPVRTFKDIVAGLNPEEAKIRASREGYTPELPEGYKQFEPGIQRVTGPTMANIPGLSQQLPEQRSPYKEGPLVQQEPVLRQLTGISKRDKNALESEVDRLQIDYRSIYPRTGDDKANRLIVKNMGPISQRLILPVIEGKRFIGDPKNKQRYSDLAEPAKRLLLRKVFSEIRKEALKKAIPGHRKLFLKLKLQQQDPDMIELLNNPEINRILGR